MDNQFECADGRSYREVKGLATRENLLHCCCGCAAWQGGRHDPDLCKRLPQCSVGYVFEEVKP